MRGFRHRGGWHYGTRRVGETLEIRDRWQGLFGPNVWLLLLLALGAFRFTLMSFEEGRSTAALVALAALCGGLLVFVAARCYPYVRLDAETIRWRNWFFVKETTTARVKLFDIGNYNERAWVPVITAHLGGRVFGRQSARFVATFSFRRRVAVVIASEIRLWAADHGIPSDLTPEFMTWRLKDPRERESSSEG